MVIDLRQKYKHHYLWQPASRWDFTGVDHVQIRDQATAIIGSRMQYFCSTAYSVVRAGGGSVERTSRVGVDPMFRNADQAVVSGHRHEPTGNVGARKSLRIEMIDEELRKVGKDRRHWRIDNRIIFVLSYLYLLLDYIPARGYVTKPALPRSVHHEAALLLERQRRPCLSNPVTRLGDVSGVGHVYCTAIVQCCWSGQKCSRRGDNRAEKGSGSATRQCDAVYYGT